MTNFNPGDKVRAARPVETSRWFGSDIEIGAEGTVIKVEDSAWSTKYAVNFEGETVEDVPEDSLYSDD